MIYASSYSLLSFICAVFIGMAGFFAWPFAPSNAATTLETVVAECKKRTNFSDATCTTLIKKYMNVERCKEYTGWGDEECKKKIEEIKNDPEFTGGTTNSPSSSSGNKGTKPKTGTVTTDQSLETARRIRAKKESDLILLWKRTENITRYLKDKGMDTGSIETHFPEFERKAEAVLAAYDTYIGVAERAPSDQAVRRQMLEDARGGIERALFDLTGFYRSNIFSPLNTLATTNI